MLHKLHSANRVLVLGRGPSALDQTFDPAEFDAVLVTDPTYVTRDVFAGEPAAVVIGDNPDSLDLLANRYLDTPEPHRPLLLNAFYRSDLPAGLATPVDLLPLLAGGGLMNAARGDTVYPTTGVVAALLAAYLNKPTTIAGIDLFRHPSGDKYAKPETDSGEILWPQRHAPACDLFYLRRIAARMGDQLNMLGIAGEMLAQPPTLDELAQSLLALSKSRRIIFGLAGIPGAGKSTLAGELLSRLPAGAATVVPMDGFHLPNQQLIEMGRRDYKGAPDTFDAAAYIDLLERLRHADEPIQVPIYDRTLHEPAPGPMIDPAVRIILTEGNYLLLDQPPWNGLAKVLDGCWFIDTPLDQARPWLIKRHTAGGRNPDDAQRHYERTDLPNAQSVLENRRASDAVIRPDWR